MGKNKILRFETAVLNGDYSLCEKSKLAIKTANVDGQIDTDNYISGIYYTSKDARTGETIAFRQYNELGRPEYIARVADGSLCAVPFVLVVPKDFSPREFD